MTPTVLTETRMTVAEAAELTGRSPQTILNWITRGYPFNGRVVKLEAVRCGRPWMTSREAVGRFLARINTDAPTGPPVPTPGDIRREVEAAKRQMRKLGVKI